MDLSNINFETPTLRSGRQNGGTFINGKMFLSALSQSKMNIKAGSLLKIGTMPNEKDSFYLFLSESQDGKTFVIRKAGKQVYVYAKDFIDKNKCEREKFLLEEFSPNVYKAKIVRRV